MWYERFESRNESVDDEQRSERPTSPKTDESMQEVIKMLRSNRRLTIRELTRKLNVKRILTDIVIETSYWEICFQTFNWQTKIKLFVNFQENKGSR